MRALLAAALLAAALLAAALLAATLLAAAPARASEEDGYDETPPIRRALVNLHLGDSLKDVRRIYSPTQEWPFHIEPRGRVTRYRIERGWARTFPAGAQTLWLGFKRGRLVDIQLIYDEQRTRERPHETLAVDMSLNYGEPRRSDNRYWWADGSTVLRVFPAEVPVLKDGRTEIVWRTSLQVADKGLFKRVD